MDVLNEVPIKRAADVVGIEDTVNSQRGYGARERLLIPIPTWCACIFAAKRVRLTDTT